MTQRCDPSIIPLSPCPESYARLVAQGWDGVQEAYAVKPLPHFTKLLEDTQAAAKKLKSDGSGQVQLELNDERMNACAFGAKGGFTFRLENDDFLVFIGSENRDFTLTVKYLSAGLWEHGLKALRDRVEAMLKGYALQTQEDAVRTTRADWCFDMYSPQFREEFTHAMSGNMVAHSGVKKNDHLLLNMWTCGFKGETLTAGKLPGAQIQLYDKTKEIDDKSGKTWMYDIWAAGMDGEWPWDNRPDSVFRLEVRMGRDFLKDRNMNRPNLINDNLPALVTEIIYTRRLCVPSEDQNRTRWPMHPLWSLAATQFGKNKVIPIGRQVTGRRQELVSRAVMQIAGAQRSATVLAFGQYSDTRMRELVERANDRIENDPEHFKKEQAAQNRYVTVDDAR